MKMSNLRWLTAAATLVFSLSVTAQTLTWSTAIEDYNTTNIGGGTTQRPTIASIVYNDEIFIAYTSSNNCSGSACAIQIEETSGQGPNGTYAFTSDGFLGVPTIGTVYTKSNPALAVADGYAYISWTDASGNNWVSQSSNMLTWSAPVTVTSGSTVESVTLSVNPSVPNELWIGYLSGSNFYPTICYLFPNQSSFSSTPVTCYNTTEVSQMNFEPGLVWSGSELLLFQEYRGNSHCLSSFYSPGGVPPWTYWNPGGLCGAEQTSAKPAPVTYNSYIYIGFRTNDSSDAFRVRIGNTSVGFPYVQQPGQKMDGGPDLLPVSTSQGISLLYPTELVNFYSYGGALYSTYGH